MPKSHPSQPPQCKPRLDHIVKPGTHPFCSNNEPSPAQHREDVELWLTALLQSERLSVLIGGGFTTAVAAAAAVRRSRACGRPDAPRRRRRRPHRGYDRSCVAGASRRGCPSWTPSYGCQQARLGYRRLGRRDEAYELESKPAREGGVNVRQAEGEARGCRRMPNQAWGRRWSELYVVGGRGFS